MTRLSRLLLNPGRLAGPFGILTSFGQISGMTGQMPMNRLLSLSCLLLASCGSLDSSRDTSLSNYAAASNYPAASENTMYGESAEALPAGPEPDDTGQSAELKAALWALFDLPESNLKTECAAADYYADRQVHPAFYDYPSPPEYDRYIECVLAEARRDGGKVRLASASSFPKVGTCYSARITAIGTRFGGDRPDRDAGTYVAFDIGLSLVDYSYVAAVARSRVGDAVRVCVHDLPEYCPAHDLRGIGYRATNLRTHERWVMGDSPHLCRGA